MDRDFEIECYRNAIEAHDNYHARYSLGRALFEAEELEQARQAFLAAFLLAQADGGLAVTNAINALKALYRTAKTIAAKEAHTLSSVDSTTNMAQRMTELVGGAENYNKIQSLTPKP